MMTELYYFSGTGNSLVVARDIARQLKGKLIPLAALMNRERIRTNADVIGIIFPVHNVVNGGVPLIIRSFLAKLEFNAAPYLFAVCTCGAGSGDALVGVAKIIAAQGGRLAAWFTVKMPFNCPPFTKNEEQVKRFRVWQEQLAEVCAAVAARREIKVKTVNALVKALAYPLGQIMHASILKNYRKLANSTELAFDEAVSFSDRSYTVDERCNGCGICAKVCPVDNIALVDRRPVWQHHCEACLACLAWCPQQAVSGGILSGKAERYHHPEVQLQDMFSQKEG